MIARLINIPSLCRIGCVFANTGHTSGRKGCYHHYYYYLHLVCRRNKKNAVHFYSFLFLCSQPPPSCSRGRSLPCALNEGTCPLFNIGSTLRINVNPLYGVIIRIIVDHIVIIITTISYLKTMKQHVHVEINDFLYKLLMTHQSHVQFCV